MKKALSFILVILMNFMLCGNTQFGENPKISNDIVSSDSAYNTTDFYYNDPTLYQDDQFASYYFSNLTRNFGNNVKGSCTYIAFAMLLSYYDTYWDDSIIPESYDMITMLSNNVLGLTVESPGIYSEDTILPEDDDISISTDDYYQLIEQYSNAHFHLKLIQLGKEKFGQYKFDNESNPCGLLYAHLVELMNYYLYDYMGFTTSEISYTSCTSNVRQFVIDNIQAGKPVLVRMGSTTVSGGHAFILYDYDEVNDELYGHWGWKYNNYEFEHIKLSTTQLDVFWDATVLNVNTAHNCSNNYKYSDGYDHLETYCSCAYGIHEEHEHTYTSYMWRNGFKHIARCVCGAMTLVPHVITQTSTKCIYCGGTVEMGGVQLTVNSSAVAQMTLNNSFILQNGVIVLADEDLDAFLNGTLIFYDKDKLVAVQ